MWWDENDPFTQGMTLPLFNYQKQYQAYLHSETHEQNSPREQSQTAPTFTHSQLSMISDHKSRDDLVNLAVQCMYDVTTVMSQIKVASHSAILKSGNTPFQLWPIHLHRHLYRSWWPPVHTSMKVLIHS